MRAKEAVPDGEAQLRERTRRSEQKRLQESTAWLGWRKNWSKWGAIWPLASNQETLREPWTVVQSNCPNVFANFEPQNSSNIKRVNWSCSFVVDMSGSLFPMSLAFFVLCLFWYPGTPNSCASAENRGQALRSTAVQQHCHCLEGCSSRQSQIQSLCISSRDVKNWYAPIKYGRLWQLWNLRLWHSANKPGNICVQFVTNEHHTTLADPFLPAQVRSFEPCAAKPWECWAA